ncbi:PQQ-binding-like beta-propeller repeat protein [Streptomyces sp. NPDC101227]|uniref:protein kinase domain-containing protein n=1 Tax=Streptomyces sp. NPDC101227 TaxID=3366136 RepID=UPI00381BF335
MRVIADRYELVAFVGRGGMGEVWEGRDKVIGRRVAVKLLPDQQHGTASDLFFREARTAGGLNHRGVVTVHDMGRDPRDGALYLVMEYVSGRNLAVVLREDGPPRPAVSVEWAAQTAAALAAAHDAGVVHRDLKPANLMLTDGGEVKVLDFGIARFMAATDKSSQVMGTLAYMAPERFGQHSGDARSDLYAFGCVLHELLTGQTPFTGGDPISLMTAHLHEAPDAPSARRAGLPAGLDALVLRLLAKDPADRPQSASAVHGELRALDLASVQVRTPTVPTPTAPAATPAVPTPDAPGGPGQPLAAHQLPTQTGTPFAPPASPGPGGTPASGAPRTLGRRSALLLGLGGVAVVAGGIGIALKTGDHTPPKPKKKVDPWEYAVEGPHHDNDPPPFAVADGALYVSTEETIVALDARTGRKRWKGPSDFSREYRFRDPLMASGGAVYAAGQIGTTYGLCALDADGRKKWFCSSFAATGHSPVVTDGIVYFTADGHVYAVHADNGRKLWNHPLGDKDSGGLAVADGTVYVSGGKALYALDAAGGARKWAFPLDSGARLDQPPVVSGGFVYVLDDVTNLHALHAAEGTRKWWLKYNGQSVRAAGHTLYLSGGDDAGNGIVHALDSTTGKRKWGYEVSTSQQSATQLALAGDLLFVASTEDKDGTVYAIDTGDGSQRWSTRILEKLGSDMAAAHGFVYASVTGRVVALDAATGAAPT